MYLFHLPAAGGIIATITLIVVLMNRRTGFDSIGTFVVATAVYIVAWVCTFQVLLALLKNGGFFSGGAIVFLHAAIGYACLRGIIEFTNSGMHWWGWPCLGPRRSPKLDHLCSDRVAHPRHRTLARKPQMGKALSSSPAPLGRWVTLREHTRVISRECRRFGVGNDDSVGGFVDGNA